MSLKILQIHKRSVYEYSNIQDKYSFAKDLTCIAVADGTTQSYNSGTWAELLCQSFNKNQVIDKVILLENFKAVAQKFNNSSFTKSLNPAKASLEADKIKKGATSTFIGVTIDEHNVLSAVSIGDSNIFIRRNKSLILFPFSSLTDLDKNQQFLNTEDILSYNNPEPEFDKFSIQLEEDDKIIIATDALSRLILNNESVLDELIEIENFSTFLNFSSKYWDQKLLEEDDLTACILTMDKELRTIEIIPHKNFSFEREPEQAFIPFSMAPAKDSYDNNQNLNHINSRLQILESEIFAVNKKLGLIKKIQYIVILFLVLNTPIVKSSINRTTKKFKEFYSYIFLTKATDTIGSHDKKPSIPNKH